MTFEQFLASLADDDPPAELSPASRALWLDGKGNWAEAHELAGEVETADGALVHAYLHRKEGDPANARYWYGQAGRPPARGSLADEWAALVREFLK